ncbi:apolipoprotein D and lipocalin family protein [Paucimonas lemoignei]|uniref:Outer membrane lipoprotein Blc n=1 Tax=Paucimonas lemoignei TaxID=29443 RepID=A0A4R3HPE8_PAULE|nr:lipocalin family protein [Paucimonas lemoignei]TCS33310.1 apolipoprotein D and lipocalin family protein [Paucimonas lemoignei]
MKSRLLVKIILLFSIGALSRSLIASDSQSSETAPLSTISSLDVARYMGDWYEIAKYPNRFQKKCASDDRAEYSLRNDGSVQVVNRCKLENGDANQVTGTARQIGGPTSPKFEVRFAPAWLSFIPAVWGDYWIIDLDDAYQLVAVSEPERKYLWILSRQPQVPQQQYEELLKRLEQKGFDTRKLVPTRHEGAPNNER